MISALWTGIAGLSSQQTALDNESNNIANVNTVGYKASRVSFADLMYQDSIGKGSSVTNAEKQYTQGSLNLTGSSYDLALDGDGFLLYQIKTLVEHLKITIQELEISEWERTELYKMLQEIKFKDGQ